ncbi:MAG: Beta-hydroxyacyl-(acyl-carrier-protein) dehydratase FabA/FabZ [Deltaproteobacteria bacterium]|jgi:predicted hotdog family 3-hydroxylacyl-ACP dehydratase|nr:Beta-hydroxyacyl-(acyl-carrier-protein) dehydratase FabA/FabZ [Deltaproteobacteria bacterium]MBP2677007.1 Beta-hydroxyacyl-(acyl-carrier-protein) dehydratase FabA/FabZ [Deltaproteobacteria bacterium]MBP2687855.1 Beta-hydroxyacyl-(acyl-carrier-protein) dehydratase FabA/FabZ [Deltaproteobacteria bacterium]MBS1243494.1 Beta-hydroxyacyl-(acyl-carrier-protein) dehydratase FabA/FabZ [Deltaproteobacteria bacterium]
MAAERLIPHRAPMRLVDTLVSVKDGCAVAESVLPRSTMMADGEGRLDEVSFMELIAQSYAAFKGYMDRMDGKPPCEGFLVGVRNLEITGRAYAGDRLLTSVRTVAALGGFAVVEGAVTRGDETLASGTLKLWLVDPDADGG